jgi:hypothetical protein
MTVPRLLLHLEGLTCLCAACALYFIGSHSWWLFAVLFLAPDLAMLGYLLGPKIGAALYNAVHTYTTVGVVWIVGHFLSVSIATPICLIWVAHIGFDRLLGYGLKYSTAFKDTYLSRV